MLTRLRIVNVQKHEDLELNLDKINVIIGGTDSGKTSVLRGLTWALTNDESGENLINNDGATLCSVTIDTEDGSVTRAWSKGKNVYTLNNKEFTTFRTSVPAPIAALFNVDNINIQKRRDPPFMVYFKASDCANQFSDMMDLSEIDTIIANSNKSVKEHADTVEKLKEKKNKLADELASLVNVDDAVDEFNKLVKFRKEIKAYEEAISTLKTLRKRHSDATCAFSGVIDPAEADMAVKRLEWLAHTVKEHLEQKSKLQYICNQRFAASKSLCKYAAMDEAAAGIEVLAAKHAKFAERIAALMRLQRMSAEYRAHAADLKYTSRIYKEQEEAFKYRFPAICPLCGKERCDD